MTRWSLRLALATGFLLLWPGETVAPLVYRPGEGWSYESPGEEGSWTRTRARDQLAVAEEAFAAGKYNLAIKAARRTVKVWPLSDAAPRARYLMARSYESKGNYQKAFDDYQRLLSDYPKVDNYQEVLERQFQIANKFLAGKWFKVWGVIPFFSSMEKTVAMYEKLIRNGPYSPVAPQAQMNIGAAREKQSSFFNRVDPFREAVEAYLVAADRYFDNPAVASDALFKAGNAYFRQARKADYDQSVAGKAIDTFTDFMTLYPNDLRVEEAQVLIGQLRAEQARGHYRIGRYYQKRKRWNGALIYYNESLIADPNSPYAEDARRRIETIQAEHGPAPTQP